jgi:hypothetical protein
MSEQKSFIGPKTQRNILIIIILLLIGGGVYFQTKYSDMQRDLAISKQNEFALSDTMRVIKKENGNLEYSKGVLVSKSKDLEKLNKDLARDLKETDGKVHRLENLVATMGNTRPDGGVDTIETKNTVHHDADGSYGLKWGDTTNFDSLNFRQIVGVSDFRLIRGDSNTYTVKPLTTKITNHKIGFKLKTGLRTNKDGMVEIFAESDYPNFQVTKMEGAIIDPNKHPVMKKFTRKKKFTVSGFVGYGIQFNNGTIGYGPQIGVGLGRTIFSF